MVTSGTVASMGDYRATYDRSIDDPEGFWGEAAELVDWIKKPQRVLDDSNPPFYRWFPDATLNTCFNALDRHVAKGAADRTALIYDSAVTGVREDLHLRRSSWRRSPRSPACCARSASGRATGS